MPTEKHFPACFVVLPERTENRRAAFYLAAEEWIARNLPDDSYLFTWQLGRTVVMGRNQVAHQEVNLDFCHENNIDVIRRKSGGGAIFADEGNIMTSLITPASMVESLFEEYAQAISQGLRKLGANTEVKGRNDVVLVPFTSPSGEMTGPQGKVCGNAFYHLADRNIVHGTMLFDTDFDLMAGALHSNPVKLQAKGVKSVRARVGVLSAANLKLPVNTVGELRKTLRRMLTDREVILPDDAITEIEKMEQAYYEPEYLYGSSARDEIVRSQRIEGCGTVEIHLQMKGTIIKNVRVLGDYFEIADTQKAFTEALVGINFTAQNINNAIDRYHPEHSIRNLNTDNLKNILNNE